MARGMHVFSTPSDFEFTNFKLDLINSKQDSEKSFGAFDSF